MDSPVLAFGLLAACATWSHLPLSPSARAVEITRAEPPDSCELVGAFSTSDDCLAGLGSGDTDQDAQLDCIRWKSDAIGGNHAVLDAAMKDGYYAGRVYRCP